MNARGRIIAASLAAAILVGLVVLLCQPAEAGRAQTLPALPSTAVDSGVPFGAERVVTDTANGARAVHAADMDGDGDIDLLAASSLDDEIAWYENDGGALPGFVGHPIGTGNYARSVYAADVDGDGDMDALSASFDDDRIAWYENDGASPPAFTPHTVTNAANGAQAVRAADLDGDGDVDVLSASTYDDRVTWYENDGASPPAFTPHVITSAADGAYAIETADVDGDGDLDVLSASREDDTVAWYENDGGSPPAFAEHSITTTADTAESVCAADVDGDGDLDVLFAAMGSNQVAWAENLDGDGTGWAIHDVWYMAYGSTHTVYATDMDSDGDADVLVAFANADEVSWRENLDGMGTLWAYRATGISADSPELLQVADLDGDGDGDVAVVSFEDDTLAWYRNETIHRSAAFPVQGHFVITDGVDGAWDVTTADVDRDGDLDVLSASMGDDTVAWYESDGALPPTFTSHIVTTAADGARAVAAADLDRDGDMDGLAASMDDDTIAWYENDGGAPPAFAGHVITDSAVGAVAVDVADLDGDGDPDVLSASIISHTVAWYENDGASPPAFAGHIITDNMRAAQAVRAADLDGDGDLDVLAGGVRDATSGETLVWYENAAGDGSAWSFHRVASFIIITVPSIDAADLDNDGDPDVIAALSGAHLVTWCENNGDAPPTFTTHIIPFPIQGIESVTAGDVDGDGDVDIFATGFADDAVAWLESDGGAPPTFTGHLIAGGVDEAAGVHVADVDSDGDLDVLSAYSHTVAWHENRGGQVALLTADTAPPALAPAGENDFLRIVAAHRGRAGDTDAELASLTLLLEESAGDPLTSAEANALIAALRLYRDEGSGAFEPGLDAAVVTVTHLSLVTGTQIIVLTDNDPRLQLAFGTPVTYFVAVELTADAANQSPRQFRLTHVTEGGSYAEDREYDLLLRLEFAPTTPSRICVAGHGLYLPLIYRSPFGKG